MKKKEKKYIGEFYDRREIVNEGYLSSRYPFWQKFKESDIQDVVEDNVKLGCIWVKKENIFYYDEIYNPIRKKIEKTAELKSKVKEGGT